MRVSGSRKHPEKVFSIEVGLSRQLAETAVGFRHVAQRDQEGRLIVLKALA